MKRWTTTMSILLALTLALPAIAVQEQDPEPEAAAIAISTSEITLGNDFSNVIDAPDDLEAGYRLAYLTSVHRNKSKHLISIINAGPKFLQHRLGGGSGPHDHCSSAEQALARPTVCPCPPKDSEKKPPAGDNDDTNYSCDTDNNPTESEVLHEEHNG